MIRYRTMDGQTGSFDVAKYVAERFPGGKVTGVKNGIIQTVDESGQRGGFSLAKWAQQQQAEIIFMEGFNNPDTALDQPPEGMNYFDQVVFFQDGMDMDALQQMFPQAMQDEDGTVKVLDNDGLWKIMWSPHLAPPPPPMTFEEEVEANLVNDPRLVLRTAGVHFLFGLAGKFPNQGKKGGVKINELVEVLRIINRNAPIENKMVIAQVVNQTTGVDPWKFMNACLVHEEVGYWMKAALDMSSFEYREMQARMSEEIVKGYRIIAQDEFDRATEPLFRMEETKKIMINLKSVFGEFIQLLVSLDLLRDISRSTGLNEWIALNEDQGFDKSRLPPMPEFVEAFVKLLRAVLPIVKDTPLTMARGVKGLRGIFHLMKMIDDCLFSLVGVPDHTAKKKMFFALKKAQTQLENKLSFHYQPNPLENKSGLKENPFMQIKEQYSSSREMIYELCQTPKESWNNTVLESYRSEPNIEMALDRLPKGFRKQIKSLLAMDFAYDAQPWVDVDHADRTHDAFSELNESFGLRPPEAGYLAKNSPRAVNNISETLIEGAAFLSELPDENVRETLRNPHLLKYMMKTLMTASVNREIGTVEILNSLGVADSNASPSPARIWEDPEKVEVEQKRQIAEIMGQMAMKQAQDNQQKEKAAMMEQAAMQQSQQPKKGAA